jgi:uncharacterized protein involved in exopolysaccharide biosynthesis
MNVIPKKRWGFVLLLIGLALIALAIRQFLIPPSYRAATVVKVGGTVPEAIGGEIEIVRSEPVLSQVIGELGLEREWSNRYNNGNPLTTAQVRQMILSRLSLRQLRSASLIEIGVTSARSDETDRIANAIAKAYRDYRRDQRDRAVTEMVSKTVKPLEEQLSEDVRQITEVQQQLHQLNVAIETNDPSSITGKLNTYVELKQQLAQLQRSHLSLQKKIGQERLKQTTGLSIVEVLSPAAPPRQPVSTPRSLGTVALWLGVLLTVSGGWLLRKPRPSKSPDANRTGDKK